MLRSVSYLGRYGGVQTVSSRAQGGLRTVVDVQSPPASTEAVRRSMAANRSRDTAPELALRRACFARGLRYRTSTRPVPELRRTADLVFVGPRVAVFLDGCFWHGCPDHFTKAKRNAGFWRDKVETNRARDEATTIALTSAGWAVLRFWEHVDPEAAAELVQAAVVERTLGGARTGNEGLSARRVPAV